MVIAGTGHRPAGLTIKKSVMYSNALVNALAEFLKPYLERYKPEIVITGGALGMDTGLAVAALKYGAPLLVAIPHYGHESKWGDKSKRLYYRILDKATWVVYTEQGPYEPWKMQARNEFMVDRADAVVALWSGAPGGTANCIKYAQAQDKQVYNLWDNWVRFKKQYNM